MYAGTARTGNRLTDAGIQIDPDPGMHRAKPRHGGDSSIGVDPADMQKGWGEV